MYVSIIQEIKECACNCFDCIDKCNSNFLPLPNNNKFVILVRGNIPSCYYSQEVQEKIMNLPVTLQARYIGLTNRMMERGPNLGLPHTDSFGGGLFELRLKGAEGIAHGRYRSCFLLHGIKTRYCHASQFC